MKEKMRKGAREQGEERKRKGRKCEERLGEVKRKGKKGKREKR